MFKIRRKFQQTSDIYAAMKMCSAVTSEAMLLATISYHLPIWQNLIERVKLRK